MGRPLHDDLDRGQPREGREDGEGTGLIGVPNRAKGAKDDALGGRGQLLGMICREGPVQLLQAMIWWEGAIRLLQATIGLLGTKSSSLALAILWQYT